MAREVGLHERAGHDRGEVFGRVHRLKNRLTEPLQIGSVIPGALLIHLTHCISMMSRTDRRLRQLTKPSVQVDNLQSHTHNWLRAHLPHGRGVSRGYRSRRSEFSGTSLAHEAKAFWPLV